MNNLHKKYFLLFFSVIIWGLSFHYSLAARLDLKTPLTTYSVGDRIRVDLLLDTQGSSVNAIEGEIIFPSEILRLEAIQDGSSIINFWVDKPKLYREGALKFAGITPGGVDIRSGTVLSLFFVPLSPGKAELHPDKVSILLNDGLGTPVPLDFPSLFLDIVQSEKPGRATEVRVSDSVPPERFDAEFARNKNIFDNKYFISFAAQDKGSGLSGYMVKEVRWKILSFFKSWRQAESPYQLSDQELRSFVFIKAIDNDGNERVEIFPPLNSQKNSFILILSSILLLSSVYISWRLFRAGK